MNIKINKNRNKFKKGTQTFLQNFILKSEIIELRDSMEINEDFIKDPIRYVIEEIKSLYLADNRPWIIGYSGGKDSTTVVELVFEAISEVPLHKRKKTIHITFSDTLVENPLIVPIIRDFLHYVDQKAKKNNLPFQTHIHKPKISDTFWVLLIGKGYPPPLQNFRWCTDRLKIRPSNEFIKNQVSKHGKVIILLGVRKEESISRQTSMEKHKIEQSKLRTHPYLNMAYIYSPIENFTFDLVWEYLLTREEEWLKINQLLYNLYAESSEEECPYVVDETTRPCGSSRFGCWVCTLVREDKSLKGFLNSDQLSDETKQILKKMINFRNNLLKYRSDREMRLKRRKTGHVYYVIRGNTKIKGLGPFTLEARKKILSELLEIQKEIENVQFKEVNFRLITDDELKYIRNIWINEGDWEDSLPKLYEDIIGKRPSWAIQDLSLFSNEDLKVLENLAFKYKIDVDIVKKLIAIEKKYLGYIVRPNITKEIKKLLFQDWISNSTDEGRKNVH